MFAERQSGFEIVYSTWFAHEAHLARSLLASRGIDAWVFDEEQIGVQWHVAGALGGVKVGVAPEDAPRARAILAEDHSAVLEEVDEAALTPADGERCARCGSAAITTTRSAAPPTATSWLSMGAFYLLGFVVPRRRRVVQSACGECGFVWSREEAA